MQFTLRAIRINNNMSQNEASQKIGISVDTLRNYESGKSFPDIPVLKRIEEVYNIKYENINFFNC